MDRFTPTFLYLTGGLVIWAMRFLGIYGLTGLACARGWAEPLGGFGVLQLIVLVTSAAAIAGCAALIWHAATNLRARAADGPDDDTGFVHYVAGGVAALAALAIVLEGLPFFLIPVCQ